MLEINFCQSNKMDILTISSQFKLFYQLEFGRENVKHNGISIFNIQFILLLYNFLLITPHVHAQAGLMWSMLASIYCIYVYIFMYVTPQKFECYFSGPRLLHSLMNLSQEMTVFGGRQKLTSAMKLRPETWW